MTLPQITSASSSLPIATSNVTRNVPIKLQENKGFLLSITNIIRSCQHFFSISKQDKCELLSNRKLNTNEQEPSVPVSIYKTKQELKLAEQKITQQKPFETVEKRFHYNQLSKERNHTEPTAKYRIFDNNELEAQTPESSYRTDSLKQQSEQQKIAAKISNSNLQTISNYQDLSEAEKIAFSKFNEIMAQAIATPEFTNQEGISRVPGVKKKIDLILDSISSGVGVSNVLINKNKIALNDLISASKIVLTQAINKSQSETSKLAQLIEKINEATEQEEATIQYVTNNQPVNSQEILKRAKINKLAKIPPLKELPLAIQIAMPLLLELVKNIETNRMTPNSIAISFHSIMSPHNLSVNQSTPQKLEISKADIAAIKSANKYLELLIQRELDLSQVQK